MKQIYILLILSVLPVMSVFSQNQRNMRDQEGNNDTTIVFADSFNANINRWNLNETKTLSSKIEEGVLELKGKTAYSPTLIAQKVELPKKNGFVLEIDLMQKSGARNMGFGLCWGARSDKQDWYAFLVSTNGKYTILRKRREEYSEIKKWTESDFIKGMDKNNVLKIIRNGEKMEYYINDHLVFISKYEALTGDQMGILFHGTMKLQVEELTIKEFP